MWFWLKRFCSFVWSCVFKPHNLWYFEIIVRHSTHKYKKRNESISWNVGRKGKSIMIDKRWNYEEKCGKQKAYTFNTPIITCLKANIVSKLLFFFLKSLLNWYLTRVYPAHKQYNTFSEKSSCISHKMFSAKFNFHTLKYNKIIYYHFHP